jgi:hypothetical protein
MRFGSLLLVIWLLIGVAAAFQRDYLSGDVDCAKASTVAVTVVAGPLNYVGANPKVDCPAVNVPQPSE